ncbi:hypothetical protein PISMIDRAFT_681276, partial [Pisolithus microcarpus 441]
MVRLPDLTYLGDYRLPYEKRTNCLSATSLLSRPSHASLPSYWKCVHKKREKTRDNKNPP